MGGACYPSIFLKSSLVLSESRISGTRELLPEALFRLILNKQINNNFCVY